MWGFGSAATLCPMIRAWFFNEAAAGASRRSGVAGRAWARPIGAAVASGLIALAGCSPRVGGSKSLEQANNDLRRENQELKATVEAQARQIEEMKIKLSEESAARLAALKPEALEALPVCAGVEVGRLSGFEPLPPVDSKSDGAGGEGAAAKSVVVYLRSFDGRDRFVQIVGTLSVEAVWLPGLRSVGDEAAAKTEARPNATVLGRVTLTPGQLRDAYRSDVLGTYYVVELPLSEGAPLSQGSLIMRAEFADALTGKVWTAERVKSVR